MHRTYIHLVTQNKLCLNERTKCSCKVIRFKNVFGGVNHNLISEVLKIHHVPDEFIKLIHSLYSDCKISVLTDSFMTFCTPWRTSRYLSPLLFNLLINTLINNIKDKKINCLGQVYNGCIIPKHWFQFVDDTALVTALDSDDQLPQNEFLTWSSWDYLIIKIGTCEIFGIKKGN